MSTHAYNATITWTGAAQGPTLSYASYTREFRAEIAGKVALMGSADPGFKGDPALHNPEDLLLISLSSCHMLTYLAQAALKKLVVVAYEDSASGTMVVDKGHGQFTEVVLRPVVTIAKGSDAAAALALHENAHDGCFIARSVNFPVRHEPKIIEAAS